MGTGGTAGPSVTTVSREWDWGGHNEVGIFLCLKSATGLLTLQLTSDSPGIRDQRLTDTLQNSLSSLFKALSSAGGHLLCPCPFAVEPAARISNLT